MKINESNIKYTYNNFDFYVYEDTIHIYENINTNIYYYNPLDSTVYCNYDINDNDIENIIKKAIDDIEYEIEQYIYYKFDIDYIKENGDYVYSILIEKSYNIINDIISNIKHISSYHKNMFDDIADIIFNEIDFEYFYKIIDNILY